MSDLITADQFKSICASLSINRINVLVPLFNEICPKYGIDTPNIFHEFFANLCEETGEFSRYEENLHYSTPERLTSVWPKRFPTFQSAMPFINNPHALAIKVYGAREDLGNITAEDGWLFRGSGAIQLTGRSNFTAFGTYMQKTFNIVNTPEQWANLVRTNEEFSLHSACWIFAIAFKLIDEAQRDEMRAIVLKINGGLTNYPLRIKYYNLAKKFIT